VSQPTSLLERTEQAQETEADGTPKYSHIVFPKKILTDAIINGTAVEALCGHTFVPGRDPKRYDVCSRCKQVFEHLHGEFGDDIQ